MSCPRVRYLGRDTQRRSDLGLPWLCNPLPFTCGMEETSRRRHGRCRSMSSTINFLITFPKLCSFYLSMLILHWQSIYAENQTNRIFLLAMAFKNIYPVIVARCIRIYLSRLVLLSYNLPGNASLRTTRTEKLKWNRSSSSLPFFFLWGSWLRCGRLHNW